MNDSGRMLFILSASRREDDWRIAEDWRRLHAKPDALPLPKVERAPRRSLTVVRRLILRDA